MQKALRALTPIPRGVSLRKALTRERLEALQECVLALAEGRNLEMGMGLHKHATLGRIRVDVDAPKAGRRSKPVYGPFVPLFTPTATGYGCKITHGVIIDHETGGASEGGDSADALIYHECANQKDGDELHEFPIEAGGTVYVKVMVLATGAVGAEEQPYCSIVIFNPGDDAASVKSVHYIPPIEPDYTIPASMGAPGVYFYKLATMTLVDGKMVVEDFCSWDNIMHYRELPIFGKVGTGTRIFKQYNPASGMYEYFSIKGIAPIEVELVDDTLEVRYKPKTDEGTPIYPGKGTAIFRDCDNVAVFTLQWDKGVVLTNIGGAGVVEVPLGNCSDGSSTGSSSSSIAP